MKQPTMPLFYLASIPVSVKLCSQNTNSTREQYRPPRVQDEMVRGIDFEQQGDLEHF